MNGHPDAFPYKVDGESLVFRTGSGTKQEALDADPVIAFEVDRVSAEFGLAWSIVVKGQPQNTNQALGSIGCALFPWQGIGKDYLARIVPESVTGRSYTLTATMTWGPPLDDATRAGIE